MQNMLNKWLLPTNVIVFSNYGPTLLIGKEAEERGLQQALWLYGPEERITEVGTMNIFVHWINENGGSLAITAVYFKSSNMRILSNLVKELVTPPINDGLILPGVTRRSILDLTKEWASEIQPLFRHLCSVSIVPFDFAERISSS